MSPETFDKIHDLACEEMDKHEVDVADELRRMLAMDNVRSYTYESCPGDVAGEEWERRRDLCASLGQRIAAAVSP